MEKKETEQKENRFAYSDDKGLKVLSEQEILDQIYGKDKKEEIKKSEDYDLQEFLETGFTSKKIKFGR